MMMAMNKKMGRVEHSNKRLTLILRSKRIFLLHNSARVFQWFALVKASVKVSGCSQFMAISAAHEIQINSFCCATEQWDFNEYTVAHTQPLAGCTRGRKYLLHTKINRSIS